jgi:hypothetical protein
VLIRRRKTLLWLDDNPESPENSRIRRGIPGHRSSKCSEELGEGRFSLVADNRDIPLEDQVDVTLFTSVDAIEAFLRHPNQLKFIKYPPSLFRIVTNRRLFVGSSGLSSRMRNMHAWKSTFPAIMIFHGTCDDELGNFRGRPNLSITRSADECEAFVSFQSAHNLAAKEMNLDGLADAQVNCASSIILSASFFFTFFHFMFERALRSAQ